jgi:anthranilate synthase component I
VFLFIDTSGNRERIKMKKINNNLLIRTVNGERFTPYSLAIKLNAKVILESASFDQGKSRYSILLIKEAFKVVQQQNDIYIEINNKRKNIKSSAPDIFSILLYFADQHLKKDSMFPIPTGGIGFLSYEFATNCDTIVFKKKQDSLNLPDACFIFGNIYIIFDHFTDKLHMIGINYAESKIDLNNELDYIEEKLNDLNFNYLNNQEKKFPAEVIHGEGEKKEFIRAVGLVKDEIIKGNLLQGVLSRRITVKTEMPAIEAYKNLRSVNPSPYMFFLDFGEYQLFGASPEAHVQVKNKNAVINPIAGTRRRGNNEDEDILLAEELLNDEKEKAEHLMLVDLARNDLGRVAMTNTVQVRDYMEIKKFSHVMHITSKVEARLKPGLTGMDAIKATFPAGTVSGAPKIKAIEIIDSIEKPPRRFYAGLVGYIESGGDLDTCITIRSALKKDGFLYLQAGAGIVYDSLALREYEETCEKLEALAVAIGVKI